MPILLYHRVGEVTECIDNLSAEKFEGHIETLKKNCIDIVSLPDYLHPAPSVGRRFFAAKRGGVQKRAARDKRVAITFDDGMKNVYRNVYPISMRYGFNFTVFLNSQFIGKSNWHNKKTRMFYDTKESAPISEREGIWFFEYLNKDEILEMKRAGIVFGSHGRTHRLLTLLSRKELKEELTLSKIEMEAILKEEVIYFSYPWGTFNWSVRREVKKSGYRAAFISNNASRRGAFLRERPFSIKRLLVRKDWDGERLISEIKKCN